jgi:hypothetical protein
MARETREERLAKMDAEYMATLTESEKKSFLDGQKKSMEEYYSSISEQNEPESNIPLVQGDLNATKVDQNDTDNSTTTSVEPTELPNNNGVVDKSQLETSSTTLPPIGEGTPQGVFSTPRAGSRVWIFFHGGDIQKPVYFAQCIPPTEYQNFYANPEPQIGENNSSLPTNIIDPTTGREDPIPSTPITNTPDNITGETQVGNIVEVPLPTQSPTTPSTGLNSVKKDLETGEINYTIPK